MADMKMRKNGNGGYLIGLTQGQLKRFQKLTVEVVVEGLIANKKWNVHEDYELAIGSEKYVVKTDANEAAKAYTVTITHKKKKDLTITKTYRTWECNDCIIRQLLELHNSLLTAADATKAKQA